jgi:hypothetical protein
MSNINAVGPCPPWNKPAIPGVPPGSGAEPLYRVWDVGSLMPRHSMLFETRFKKVDCLCGVRFPASEEDPGRFYRKSESMTQEK